MRRHRNLKIVATLGPSSSDYETIRALFESGADVFRLNMSHGDHEDVGKRHEIIREVEKDCGRPITILADLQGPKIRCGAFGNGEEELEIGQDFRFDLDDAPGDKTRVQLPHKEIFQALEPGSRLLVNDGKIAVKVRKCAADFADCEVIVGGTISNNKGVNVPDVVLPLAALSEKDKRDLEFVCTLGVDWLALSFVQRAADVEEARELVGNRAAIMSKIEKPAAVTAYEEILAASDGIMVARGDLGVEMPVHAVPPIQKRLVRGARRDAKPVIIATQMLESMITSPVPTRAEVSDVAAAIYEGADAVMLSAESAAGEYPIEAVRTMNSVAIEVENDPTYREVIEASRPVTSDSIADGIVGAARQISERVPDIQAICCFSESGTTVSKTARERPRVPIIALTSFLRTARRMGLTWGAHCVIVSEVERFKMAVVAAARAARTEGFASESEKIIVVAGVPFNVAGSTNILRVAPCAENLILKNDPG